VKLINLTTAPVEEYAHLRCVVLPSGIGEFQWAWTKLCNTGEKFAIFSLDGAPRRLHQFAELHPGVEAFGWVGFDYSQIRAFQKMHELDTWAAVTRNFGPGQLVFLACNPHLEAGFPLRDWMPDLPVSYTYDLHTSVRHKIEAEGILHGAGPSDVLIGISCASYRGAAAWKTWDDVGWTELLTLVQRRIPNARFVLLGGSWDDVTSAVYNPDGPLRWQLDRRGLPPVGLSSFGGAVEVLKRLAGYIGFSSGLGHVAAHLCGCPVAMLWPDHEYDLLSTSWVNPELLANGSYVPLPWHSPGEVFERITPWLSQLRVEALSSPR